VPDGRINHCGRLRLPSAGGRRRQAAQSQPGTVSAGFGNKSYVDGIKECLESDASYAAMKALPRNETKGLSA
jgi:hypothetical protein